MDNSSGDRLRLVADVLFSGVKAELARFLGLKPQTLSKYLSGDINMGGGFLKKLSSLGVNADWMLTGKGDMMNPQKLIPDEQWKRLIIVRDSVQINNGSPQRWAKSLGVSLQEYLAWEYNQSEIPPAILHKIYEMIKTVIRSEWWYEGKGDKLHEVHRLPGIEIREGPSVAAFTPTAYTSAPTPEDEIRDAFQYLYDKGDITQRAIVFMVLDRLKTKGVDVQIRQH